jgi:hypothetical protein
MPFSPGDIVSFDFLIPSTGKYLTHSAVVLSSIDVYNHDGTYVCAMMSSNNANDKFTFTIDNSMLQNANNKGSSQVRCHLITYVDAAKVRPTMGSPFNRLNR